MSKFSVGFQKKMKTMALLASGATIFFTGINIVKGNELFFNDYIMPIGHYICSPETAHKLAILGCKYKIFSSNNFEDPDSLKTTFFGHILKNPLGIAAGFDKQGEAVEGLEKIGFGFVEIGSVTPLPQLGNPKPRVFRLPLDKGIINRYGFNSDGHAVVYERVLKLKNCKKYSGLLGINLGKNKTSDDALSDYVKGVELFGPIADYLVINVSSPNTPGLRDLQNKGDLEKLLCGVVQARNKLQNNQNCAIFLKISPDLTKQDITDISTVIKQKNCKIDGLIISNTTVDRNDLKTIELLNETGGLSGVPLKDKSTKLIAEMYHQTNGKIPIIGVGGIFNGEDAYEKILAGSSYLQLYTALVYHGPPIVSKIKRELDILLKKDGYSCVSDAVGKKNKSFLSYLLQFHLLNILV